MRINILWQKRSGRGLKKIISLCNCQVTCWRYIISNLFNNLQFDLKSSPRLFDGIEHIEQIEHH